MTERTDWSEIRQRRMKEPGAQEANHTTDLAFELGAAVRQLREQHGWTQTELARAAHMTQSAVARFEAGGTVPTVPILDRLAHALNADLVVRVTPRVTPPRRRHLN